MLRMILITAVLCFSIVSESSGQYVKIKFRAPSDYYIYNARNQGDLNYNKFDLENDGISEIVMVSIYGVVYDSTIALIYDGASNNFKYKIKWLYKYGTIDLMMSGFCGFCDIDGDNVREAVARGGYSDTTEHGGWVFINLSNGQVKYFIEDNFSNSWFFGDIDKDGYVEMSTTYLIIGHSATPVVNPITNLGKRTAASASLYPNPFSGFARLEYYVPVQSSVKLKIFEASGRMVRMLFNGTKSPGDFFEIWNGKSDRGENLASGQYYYTIQIGDFVTNKKMIMLK
jgi:hypothetical protein